MLVQEKKGIPPLVQSHSNTEESFDDCLVGLQDFLAPGEISPLFSFFTVHAFPDPLFAHTIKVY